MHLHIAVTQGPSFTVVVHRTPGTITGIICILNINPTSFHCICCYSIAIMRDLTYTIIFLIL